MSYCKKKLKDRIVAYANPLKYLQNLPTIREEVESVSDLLALFEKIS